MMISKDHAGKLVQYRFQQNKFTRSKGNQEQHRIRKKKAIF